MIAKRLRVAVLAIPAVVFMTASVSAQDLMGAFAFGSRNLDCEIPGSEESFTMIHHAGNNQDAHNALAYTAEKGYGFVVTDPGNTGRNGAEQFGPFDDSPNNRNRHGDDCPGEIYDSFIGFKNFETPCNTDTEGDPNVPCGDAEGGLFRVDVPNGLYRVTFVGGEADNPHAHRFLLENGGDDDVSTPGNHVVLVGNHDQAQFVGGPRADRLGAGIFCATGFEGAMPPTEGSDPKFVFYDESGNPVGDVGEGQPSSPTLQVTNGYVQLHALQGNSNPGPGGPDGDGNDPNGGDIVLLMLWRVGDNPPVPASSTIGNIVLVLCAAGLGLALLFGRKKLVPARA